jgi:hypothetical protein
MDYTKEVGSILNLRDEKHARYHITSKCTLVKCDSGQSYAPAQKIR